MSPDLTGAEFHKSSLGGTHDDCVEAATNLPGQGDRLDWTSR
ncbi:hypothetical protein [Streptosporangium saharense]